MKIMGDGEEGGVLGVAMQRLDRALAKLEVRVNALASEAQSHNGGLFDMDRSKLGADLDASLDRERALREAGEQASQALGRAIEEIQTALFEAEGTEADVPEADGPEAEDAATYSLGDESLGEEA
jgi:hypothetical protein